MVKNIILDKIIDLAIYEDMPNGDITTDVLFSMDESGTGEFVAKEPMIVAGLNVVERVLNRIDKVIRFEQLITDGMRANEQSVIAKASGSIASLLKAERISLNFLQRMSGIATTTNKFVELIKDTGVKICDTRKTTPGLRALEKYAVKIGGGYNHRFSLSDAALIKDNHIIACGGIENAIGKIKKAISHTVKIEVEVSNIEEAEEAVRTGANIIMLDNMKIPEMKETVRLIRELSRTYIIIEASGNISLSNIRDVALTGVDVISLGCITHSARGMDISFRLSH